MKRQLVTLLILAVVVVGAAFGVTKLVMGLRSSRQAGVKIISIPQASVFIDDDLKGKTPFDQKTSAGTYLIKLTPEGTETASWQKQIDLQAGLITYINRELGESELTSAGEVLILENTGEDKSSISVISTPDGATVALDGQEKGTTPLLLSDIEPGEHTLFVFAPGFRDRQVKINSTQGHKLIVDMQLALVAGEKEATDSAEKSSEEGSQEGDAKSSSSATLKILDTPTGWLRVRSEPTLSASESAKVDPGDEFELLDEQEGWYKIEYEKGKEGWISSRYADKVEK